jgi:hypothetical protein
MIATTAYAMPGAPTIAMIANVAPAISETATYGMAADFCSGVLC